MPSVRCCLSQELDRWEERLEELFEGRPYDEYDAALTETISRFPVDIQPFRDMARPTFKVLYHGTETYRGAYPLWLADEQGFGSWPVAGLQSRFCLFSVLRVQCAVLGTCSYTTTCVWVLTYRVGVVECRELGAAAPRYAGSLSVMCMRADRRHAHGPGEAAL